MRFLADMGISSKTVAFLKELGPADPNPGSVFCPLVGYPQPSGLATPREPPPPICLAPQLRPAASFDERFVESIRGLRVAVFEPRARNAQDLGRGLRLIGHERCRLPGEGGCRVPVVKTLLGSKMVPQPGATAYALPSSGSPGDSGGDSSRSAPGARWGGIACGQ